MVRSTYHKTYRCVVCTTPLLPRPFRPILGHPLPMFLLQNKRPNVTLNTKQAKAQQKHNNFNLEAQGTVAVQPNVRGLEF